MLTQLSGSQRILLLMDHSLDFVELLGRQGIIEGVSAAIKPLGGYEPEDLIGQHFQDMIHPDDCAPASEAFARILLEGRAEPTTLRYKCKDGSWRTIQASARNFLTDPAVHAIVVLTRDVTDQIGAETALAKANALLRRLSQLLIKAHETERNSISQELHDDVQQIVVGLRMSMESTRGTALIQATPEVIETWILLAQEVLDHLHALSMTLRAPTLGARGLPTELRAYVDRTSKANGLDIQLDVSANWGLIPPLIELACFRIIQEASTNSIKHSSAKHVYVSAQRIANEILLSIRDDGSGFDVATKPTAAFDAGRIGLFSMRERANLAGGTFEIRSSLGGGTSVCARFKFGEVAESD